MEEIANESTETRKERLRQAIRQMGDSDDVTDERLNEMIQNMDGLMQQVCCICVCVCVCSFVMNVDGQIGKVWCVCVLCV
jgi:hypothetical protein